MPLASVFHGAGDMWQRPHLYCLTLAGCITQAMSASAYSVKNNGVAHSLSVDLLDSHLGSVMRRERLPLPRGLHAAETFEDDAERSGPSSSSATFLFSSHEALARHRTPASACSAFDCGFGKLLKPEAYRPSSCAVPNSCTEQECCVGTCPGFQCPSGTNLTDNSKMPAGCAGLACSAEECCVGTCALHTCPQFSQKMPVSQLPPKCNAYTCESNECCFGECPGIDCPAGANKKDTFALPSLCAHYPCQHSECCEAKCTSSLCTAGNFSKVLMPGAAGVACIHYPCDPAECCLGTCGENVCEHTQPINPTMWPAQCDGFHCTTYECCVGACNSSFCSSAADKEPRHDAGQCADRDCTDEECCLGKCASSMCPTEFGLTPKDGATLPAVCHEYNCTSEECCNGICTAATCPAAGGFSLKSELPDNCGAYACNAAECCNGICTESTCPASAGKKLMDNPPSVCAEATCVYSECCVDLGMCHAGVCALNKVLDPAADLYCNGTTCTSAQCCTNPGQCVASDCTTTNFVLKTGSRMPPRCSNATCTEEECCEKAKYVYWIEKTGGAIRRCRYDACHHDTVEVVKSDLLLPEGITFDHTNNKLYFTDTNNDKIYRCVPGACESQTELMVSDAAEPVRLALDNGTGLLYWTERQDNKIYRCDIATVPCGPKVLVVEDDAVTGSYYGLALDNIRGYLYFTTQTAIYRCTLTALPCSSPTEVASSLTNVAGLAYDFVRQKLYWTSAYIIEEISVASSAHNPGVVQVSSGVDFAHGIAVDSLSGTLYLPDGVASGTLSKIKTCDVLNCADPTVMISGCPGSGCMNMPYDVALDW